MFIHRITPASGIYVNYYGINRTEDHETERDYHFPFRYDSSGHKKQGIF
jgi:hypothetical protein